MKIRIKDLRASHDALLDLGQTTMPGALGMRVALAIRAVREPMGAYGDAFNALLAKHGSPGESVDGKQSFNIAPANMPALIAEDTELGDVEVEIPVEKIAAAAFAGVGALKPGTLAALDWLIDLAPPA